MKIEDLLTKDLMIMDLEANTKEAVIDEMINRLVENAIIDDVEVFKEGIMEREAQTSTGLGDGIAMPHSKNSVVNQSAVLFAKSKTGVDFEALDNEPVHLFFMIAAPEGENDLHLQVLASLARSLVDATFIADLKKAESPERILELFKQKEAELNPRSNLEEHTELKNKKRPFIVAVTACPTGIAHTYMAEEALKETAKKLNVEIRVETNGSSGVGNQLTAAEINRADGVIVAADTKVETSRFDGKKVIQRPVSDGINKSEELINQIVAGKAAIFHADQGVFQADEPREDQSIWNRTYKDLMNGVSYMLPFVVGGGILIAISFLFESLLGSESIWFTSLNAIGLASFNFLIPILAGYIAMSIADRPGLLPGMAAGLLAENSKAGFLGGLVAGFIAGYVILMLKKSLKSLPKSLEGLKTILLFPVLGLLITGVSIYFLVGPVFATINSGMLNFLENIGTANTAVLGALLGGMMAVDMGGPFNKSAYAFSIGIYLDTGDGSLMAAVMAGGMIPPLAIALATRLFPDKFTKIEKQSALSNFIMGASFITEGAIPFAAADPLRVIGSSVLGAAVAGGLTQFWNVSIPAPHGGVFVVPLSNHPFMFLFALIIGSIISAGAMGLWKPRVVELRIKK